VKLATSERSKRITAPTNIILDNNFPNEDGVIGRQLVEGITLHKREDLGVFLEFNIPLLRSTYAASKINVKLTKITTKPEIISISETERQTYYIDQNFRYTLEVSRKFLKPELESSKIQRFYFRPE
jgi:hypothetical protein